MNAKIDKILSVLVILYDMNLTKDENSASECTC